MNESASIRMIQLQCNQTPVIPGYTRRESHLGTSEKSPTLCRVSGAVGLLSVVGWGGGGVINPHRDLRGPRVIRHSRGPVTRKNNARGSR